MLSCGIKLFWELIVLTSRNLILFFWTHTFWASKFDAVSERLVWKIPIWLLLGEFEHVNSMPRRNSLTKICPNHKTLEDGTEVHYSEKLRTKLLFRNARRRKCSQVGRTESMYE